MSSKRETLAGWFRRIGEDRKGTVAAVIAMAAVPLIGLAGLGIDTARGYILRHRMAQALDAAALAGGRAMFSATRDQDVAKFYFANIPQDFLGATLHPPTVSVSENRETITLTASAELPSTFTRVLGVEEMGVAARTVVRRANRGLELVMVLDNTGSMQDNDKLGKMKAAATDLINILYGGNETGQNLYVGLVPYTTAVNIGPSRAGWFQAGTFNPNAFLRVTWRGCVEARSYPYEESQADASPATMGFKPYFFASTYGKVWYDANGNRVSNDNDWRSSTASYSHAGNGPNKYCLFPQIMPLQPSKSTALSAINAMVADSVGTITNVGLAWGWRMLSPNWRGQWGGTTPAELPLDYHTPGMDKVLIVLTDGLTNMPAGNGRPGCYSGPGPCAFPYGWYTAFGRLSEGRLGTVDKDQADTVLNNRILETCTAAKAQGVKVYTIVLDTPNTGVQNLFRNCATAPDYYYNSPSADDLAGVFQQIAIQLSNLRLQE